MHQDQLLTYVHLHNSTLPYAKASLQPTGSDMLDAPSIRTAWPFLDFQNTSWAASFEVCAPEECFLRVSSSLLPHRGDDETTEACFQRETKQQYASVKSGSSTGGAHKAQQPEQTQQAQQAGIRVVRAVCNYMQQLWSKVRLLLRNRAASDTASTAGEQTEHSTAGKQREHTHLQACIQTLINVVSAPYRPYMKGLHAIPSPSVVQSLAAMPQTSEASAFFAEFKASSIAAPTISFHDFTSLSPQLVEFEIHSDVVAAYVYLETNISGKFSDNGMLLLPWQHTSVAFLAEQLLQVQILEDTLTALSVSDTSFIM